MKQKNQEKGITLIALVITIVVLLILAGITILALSGENGILKRTVQANEENTIGQEKEQVELAYMSAKVKKLSDAVTTTDLQAELNSSVGANKTLVTTGSSTFNVHFYDTNHNYTVKSGTVTRVADGEPANAGLGDWIAAWVQDTNGWDSTTYYPEDKTDEQLNAMGTIVARLYKNGNTVEVDPETLVDAYSIVISGDGKLESPQSNEAIGEIVFPVGTAWVKKSNSNYDSEKLGGEITNVIISDGICGIANETFQYFEYLTSITIANSVTSIGNGAFSSCKALTNITIPNSVTSIGNSAFSSCKALTNITIPNSVTSIGNHAFSSCKALTNITIPNSVTSIGNNAFSGCEALTNITIPNSVTSIEVFAFYNCSNLTTINYTGTKEQWDSIIIDTSGNDILKSASVTINYNYTE